MVVRSATLKAERLSRTRHFTRNQTRADVIDYIKRLYDLRRRNSMLDYLSPLEFEETLAR